MPFGLDAHPHVRQREVGIGGLGHGNALYGVTLILTACSIQGILQFHIRIERIVFRTGFLLGDGIVQGGRHLGLIREELTQLYAGRRTIGAEVIRAAFVHPLLQSAKPFRGIATRHIHITHIRQLHVQCALCSPATFVVVFLQSELVHPYLTRLQVGRQVTHTDNHGLDIAQCRITHDTDLVIGFFVCIGAIHTVIRSPTFGLGLVTLLLQVGENRERHIQHVLLGPYSSLVGNRIAVIRRITMRRELQWNLILIVVTLVVRTQSHEHGQLVVLQVRGILLQGIGMYEHLDAFILSQIHASILIYCL